MSCVSPLGVTLHQDVARLDRGADANHAAFVEIAQERIGDVRDVARDFFRSELGVARFDFELFDVDRGVVVILDQFFADQDGVLEVAAAPWHERHEHVPAERQLALIGARPVRDDVTHLHLLALAHDRLLIDAGVLIRPLELGELVNVGAHLA